LAARGLRVHPLRPGTKVAVVKDWPALATTDQATIEAWWRSYPDANIGVATGDGLVVLDIDGPTGETSLNLKQAASSDTRPTFTVKTPHGHHLYYLTAIPVRNSAGRHGPGLDVRGEHGYVVGPGSSVDGAVYTVVSHLSMAPAPKWVTEPPPAATTQTVAPGEPIPVGQQDETLYKIACRLRGKGWNYDGILAEIQTIPLDHADGRRPYELADYQRLARSACQHPKGEPPVDFTHNPASRPLGSAPEPQPPAEQLAGVDLVDLAAQPIAPEPPSLKFLGEDGILFAGHMTLFDGYAKVGKSTALLFCFADWVEAGHTVLILTEEPHANWQRAIQRHAPRLVRGVRVVEGRGLSAAQVLQLAEEAPEDVVVIDTARHLLDVSDENDPSGVARALRPYVNVARGGRSVIVVHHENKNQGRISGTTAWESEPDRLVTVKRDGDEDSRARKVRSWGRGARDHTLLYSLAEDDRTLSVNRVVLRNPAYGRDVVLDVVLMDPQSTAEIIAATGLPMSMDTARRRLEELEEQGKVVRRYGERGHLVWSRNAEADI
jgi:hypothetical protein